MFACSINLDSHFSPCRLKPYRELLKCKNDDEVLAAYLFMTQLSTPLLTAIHILEITFRNKMNSLLSQRFSTNWFNFVPAGQSADIVKEALKSLKNKTNFSPDDVISNLNFGFWVHLLSNKHENPADTKKYIWDSNALSQIFPNNVGLSLRDIFDKFRHSTDIRNRLCHHEPMWKDKKANSVKPDRLIFKIKAKYKHLLSLLGLMSYDAVDVVMKSGVLGFTDLDAHFDSLYRGGYSHAR